MTLVQVASAMSEKRREDMPDSSKGPNDSDDIYSHVKKFIEGPNGLLLARYLASGKYPE